MSAVRTATVRAPVTPVTRARVPLGARLRVPLLLLTNVAGLLAFVWPFALPALVHPGVDHRMDSGLILVVLLGGLGGLLFTELGRGGLGPKTVALIGVLGAAMVALRLPGFVAGFNAFFIVVLVAGNSFGPGFGFLLGAVGMFASGLLIGGLGPWLPFEMVAVGWLGAGAGFLPGSGTKWPVRIGALAVYGVIGGYLYGAIMNLWAWPFLTSGSALAWDPSAAPLQNLQRYATYYAATSFGWDTFRAAGDAIMVVTLGRPLLACLDRAAKRMRLDIRDADPDSAASADPDPSTAGDRPPATTPA